MQKFATVLALLALAGCASEKIANEAVTAPTFAAPQKPGLKARMARLIPGGEDLPWRDQPHADEWTVATVAALQSEGVTLLSSMPSDVLTYCPGYAKQNPEQRLAFWTALLAQVAGQESGWNPKARGAQGVGLMPIGPQRAQDFQCHGLMSDGAANMACAVRILNANVAKDGVIAQKEDQGWTGAARQWLSFRDKSERNELAEFTRRQSYCRS